MGTIVRSDLLNINKSCKSIVIKILCLSSRADRSTQNTKCPEINLQYINSISHQLSENELFKCSYNWPIEKKNLFFPKIQIPDSLFPPKLQMKEPAEMKTSIFESACACSIIRSCLTLCDPMIITRQTPLSMGFSRQEYRSDLPRPPPGHLPDPGIKPASLLPPALADEFFTTQSHLGCPIFKSRY